MCHMMDQMMGNVFQGPMSRAERVILLKAGFTEKEIETLAIMRSGYMVAI